MAKLSMSIHVRQETELAAFVEHEVIFQPLAHTHKDDPQANRCVHKHMFAVAYIRKERTHFLRFQDFSH